jgi:hypothetical protein
MKVYEKSRYWSDFGARWYPMLNLWGAFFVALGLVCWVVYDIFFSGNSKILALVSPNQGSPLLSQANPEAIVAIAGAILGSALAAFFYIYNDQKSRFVWAHMAQMEVDAILDFICDHNLLKDLPDRNTMNLPSNLDEVFNLNSGVFIYMNFRFYKNAKAMYLRLKSYTEDPRSTSQQGEASNSDFRLNFAIACMHGVVAARILGSRNPKHKTIYLQCLDLMRGDVNKLPTELSLECRRYFYLKK